MNIPPGIVEQLLDARPICSFFRNGLLTDRSSDLRCSEPFCTTVVWPMMMEAFDVMFSGKPVCESRRLMTTEPMKAFYLLLVCELIHNAE